MFQAQVKLWLSENKNILCIRMKEIVAHWFFILPTWGHEENFVKTRRSFNLDLANFCSSWWVCTSFQLAGQVIVDGWHRAALISVRSPPDLLSAAAPLQILQTGITAEFFTICSEKPLKNPPASINRGTSRLKQVTHSFGWGMMIFLCAVIKNKVQM